VPTRALPDDDGTRILADHLDPPEERMLRLWKWLVLGLVVVAGLAFAGWYFFLKTDPEPRAAIKDTPVVTESTVTGQTGSGLDGTWTVASGNSQNFVGYRVTEKLFANISETEATGRTHDVTASMKIDGTTVSDVTVTADLRDLQSDNSFRDGRIRSEGLESDQFPQAKFVLTSPIQLSAVPAAGETIKTRATGDFTLHGVTKPVTIDLEGRWDGKQVQVVGSLPIVFSDYKITAPTAPAVASVDDHGEMELQLFFDRAG
jgi:polyisoprenoid-binding protein YceI